MKNRIKNLITKASQLEILNRKGIITQNKNRYKIKLYLPSAHKADLALHVENSSLILATKHYKQARCWQLPSDARLNHISYDFNSGVLEITIPRQKVISDFNMN